MPARLSALLLASILAVGCATAKGAYADGMKRETAGDYAGAAHEYATALERDPSIRNVPGRLAVAGREAVRQHVARAGASAPDVAGRHYLDADALLRRAERLGVRLERPATFDRDRDAAFDAAVAFLLDDAHAARAAGDYPAALDRLRRTAPFRPDAGRQRDADALALAVYADWAEDDLAAGRYRAGLDHVEAALDLAPGDVDLLDLRDAVLDAGTVVAAVLPAEGAEDVPRAFLRDLTDVLVDEHLALPPPFVALVDPADVRRWDRRERPGSGLADRPRQLADAARDLGADLGVVVALAPLREQTVVGDVRTETAAVRGRPGRAPYSVRQVTLTVSAQADVVAAEAGSRRRVCDRAVAEQAAERYDLATTSGDWRDLDLSRSERAAFADDAAERARDRALDALRDRLAAALAGEIVECLQDQVP